LPSPLSATVVWTYGLSAPGLRRIKLAKRIQSPVRNPVASDRAVPADRQLCFRRQELSAVASLRTAVMCPDVHASMSAAVHARDNEVQT
jgi:hypothetical protein